MRKSKHCAAVSLLASFLTTSAMPIQITVPQRTTECLYEKVEAGEYLTFSVFILSGAELRGEMVIEGPVSPLSKESSKDFNDEVVKYDLGHRYTQHTTTNAAIDFEEMNEKPEEYDDDDDDDNIYDFAEGGEPVDENGNPDMEALKRIAEERRKKVQRARERARERRIKRERLQAEVAKKVREEGDPEERTIKAAESGWYRGCIKGRWHQVRAEVELRKSSDFGGVDPETEHVYTWVEKQAKDEEARLAEMSAKEEGINPEDFDSTRKSVRDLRRVLSQIQVKQNSHRHNIINHAQTNAHTHSKMVVSTLVQTVIFIMVSGYQVYTIRKWFSGSSTLLGR